MYTKHYASIRSISSNRDKSVNPSVLIHWNVREVKQGWCCDYAMVWRLHQNVSASCRRPLTAERNSGVAASLTKPLLMQSNHRKIVRFQRLSRMLSSYHHRQQTLYIDRLWSIVGQKSTLHFNTNVLPIRPIIELKETRRTNRRLYY